MRLFLFMVARFTRFVYFEELLHVRVLAHENTWPSRSGATALDEGFGVNVATQRGFPGPRRLGYDTSTSLGNGW